MNEDQNNPAGLPFGQHLEPEDLMSYVLDLLPPDERQAAQAHLDSGCTPCLQEFAALEDDLGVFALASITSSGMQSAPAGSRDRLMTAIGRVDASTNHNSQPQSTPLEARPASASTAPAMGLLQGGRAVAESDLPATRPGSPLTAWIGWAVAAALAVASVHFYQDREALRGSVASQTSEIARLSANEARARQVVDALTDRGAQRVTLSLTKAPGPPQPTGRATYLANKGTLIFLASHLDPLPTGKTYELWVIPTSGAAPVAVGTFQPDAQGNANVVTAKLAGTGAAKALGVTIENAGGSTTPTMPILLAGS